MFERVKEKYLLFRRLRINIQRISCQRKHKKQVARKRSKKRIQKKVSHSGG